MNHQDSLHSLYSLIAFVPDEILRDKFYEWIQKNVQQMTVTMASDKKPNTDYYRHMEEAQFFRMAKLAFDHATLEEEKYLSNPPTFISKRTIALIGRIEK